MRFNRDSTRVIQCLGLLGVPLKGIIGFNEGLIRVIQVFYRVQGFSVACFRVQGLKGFG